VNPRDSHENAEKPQNTGLGEKEGFEDWRKMRWEGPWEILVKRLRESLEFLFCDECCLTNRTNQLDSLWSWAVRAQLPVGICSYLDPPTSFFSPQAHLFLVMSHISWLNILSVFLEHFGAKCAATVQCHSLARLGSSRHLWFGPGYGIRRKVTLELWGVDYEKPMKT
jgi:hypothetical protein